jgi:two-component system KDP operon response regulator KdpE
MSERKILVVDDELRFCRAMRLALSEYGYDVTDAQSGEAGLETLQTEASDLVLLDMNLPGMDGPETCRAIRAISAVPIIIVSVRDGEKDKARAIDAGANAYLTMPFDMHELLAQIRLALHE